MHYLVNCTPFVYIWFCTESIPTVIDDVIDWSDDYIFGANGWVYTTDPDVDFDQATTPTKTGAYHGPYYAIADPMEEFVSLTRSFSCSRVSTLMISYKFMACRENGHAAIFLYLDGSPIDDGGTYTDDLDWDFKYLDAGDTCDGGEWYYIEVEGTDGIEREKGEVFEVQIDIGSRHGNDWIAFTDFHIDCIFVPTTAPTAEPTTDPPDAPTPAPPGPAAR